ncbi:ethanolamine utilization protein EutN [Hathewaya proteolytica DSM 3090]|uniref:Ethanolamine utilization protein EutN n=1 Tax=Hathewaya proteolytica DSM 3090 TaxID=1121331 RepID=A0A1M6KCL6_9CLOT|nr:EutN/CcmL family microcompartment protein [Hathewaya proteolytica]SHJ56678.1 ethanolamine utilization protein EutN [Hathewaya proteolytica DSM 3090]
MFIGEVIGNVWATKKDEKLEGLKLMVVVPCDSDKDKIHKSDAIVAADIIGAGIGDKVLIATGGAARVSVRREAPLDAAIVGIIDSVDIQE